MRSLITSRLSITPPHCFQFATACQFKRSPSSASLQDVPVNHKVQAQDECERPTCGVNGTSNKGCQLNSTPHPETHTGSSSNDSGIHCVRKRVVIYQHSCANRMHHNDWEEATPCRNVLVSRCSEGSIIAGPVTWW